MSVDINGSPLFNVSIQSQICRESEAVGEPICPLELESVVEAATFDGVGLDVFTTSSIAPYSEAKAVEEATTSSLKPQREVEDVGEAIASPLEPQSEDVAVEDATASPSKLQGETVGETIAFVLVLLYFCFLNLYIQNVE